MARITDKISVQQFVRLLKTAPPEGLFRLSYVVGDSDEELLIELEISELRESQEQIEALIPLVEDHSNAQSPGVHKYAARVYRESDGPELGRMVGATWLRMVRRRGDADDEDSGLDGSVASYVQQLQRSLESASKTNLELTKTVTDTLRAQGDMVKALFARQTELERERSELIVENLDWAAKAALAPPPKVDGDDPMGEAMKLFVPIATHGLVERLAPALIRLISPDVTPAPEPAPTPRLESPSPEPEPGPAAND